MGDYNIAIDGPAGAGKSSVAQQVAKSLHMTYVDTGAMYRALALLALEIQCDLESEEQLVQLLTASTITLKHDEHGQRVIANGKDVTEEIRSQLVSRHASTVAKHPRVRQLMVEKQREMARDGHVVMDGRDIGTRVLPNACCKIFLTASVEERARRRYEQLLAKGEKPSYQEIYQEIQVRDQRDRERAASPLIQADDAILIDTTAFTLEEVVSQIIAHYQQKVGQE
ncbi:(d)CMP kinase [Rubeoparvulum massiliense]|uniref:(d)CMP kinase n=1 Tax=Rubeoparvulum massiliense TaxID=1631346 RepID=UPI00065DDBC6|nr:(d)CMP kinase [Rubeoparvulum massiliense]